MTKQSYEGAAAATFLRGFAAVVAILSVVAAVVVWSTAGQPHFALDGGEPYVSTGVNAATVLAGFLVLGEGILLAVLTYAIGVTVDHLIAIRRQIDSGTARLVATDASAGMSIDEPSVSGPAPGVVPPRPRLGRAGCERGQARSCRNRATGTGASANFGARGRGPSSARPSRRRVPRRSERHSPLGESWRRSKPTPADPRPAAYVSGLLVGLVPEVRSEPPLRLLGRLAPALRVVLDLVAPDAPDREVPRLRVRQVQAADRCRRRHRERLRQRDAGSIGAEQVEQPPLLAVIGARRVAERRPESPGSARPSAPQETCPRPRIPTRAAPRGAGARRTPRPAGRRAPSP